jgi:hypothetical protein
MAIQHNTMMLDTTKIDVNTFISLLHKYLVFGGRWEIRTQTNLTIMSRRHSPIMLTALRNFVSITPLAIIVKKFF